MDAGTGGGTKTLNKLIELVGTGSTNVSTATELARVVESDFAISSSGLQKLANCGAHGSCPQNDECDFHRLVKGALNIKIEPYNITLNLEASHLRFFRI